MDGNPAGSLARVRLDNLIDFLCRESLPRRVLRLFRFLSPKLADPDHVSMLRHHPLGMFFYNLRFIIFLLSGTVLLSSAIGARLSGVHGFVWLVLLSLAIIWGVGVAFTLKLHHSFRTTLDQWAREIGSDSFPRVFYRYFVFDAVLVIIVFALGRVIRVVRPEYGFDAFCWLLLANTIVYTGYDLSSLRSRYRLVLALPALVALVLLVDLSTTGLPSWLTTSLQTAPIAAACLVSVFAVYTITRARRLDANRVDDYIKVLGVVGDLLAPPDFDATIKTQRAGEYHDYRVHDFHARLNESLRRICDHEKFWFSSACLWLVEYHKDRGDVLIPAASVNIPTTSDYANGIAADSSFLDSSEPVLVRSLALAATTPSQQALWRFRLGEDIPAALAPIWRAGRRVGVLVFYGDARTVPVVIADRTFLFSLAAIVANTLEQWETFLRALALDELDALFGCRSLDELLGSADRLLKRYLAAGGCMIVFRPDPSKLPMFVRAADGFSSTIINSPYRVGVGQTGRCAESGETKRIDDVPSNASEFDARLLRRLERAHGASVTSWMAIPIGPPDNNYGVIKAVNSQYPCKWFTTYDERLGRDIAVRLLVMIEKLLFVEGRVAATLAAERSAEDAKRSAANALRSQADAETERSRADEKTARREQDIMTVMHQLQAPLLAISNALTAVDSATIDAFNSDLLVYATALVEDAINLGFGTVTVFANESGRATMFQEAEIDASSELEGLTRRLQRTQARDDLRFTFNQEPGFPRLRMDVAVFASVFYSLIHNAMKYADDNSEVVLECGFESPPGLGRRPALKVKTVGAPIALAEKEAVFDKFVRGKSVERGKQYKGVGLGLWVARGLMKMLGGSLTLELSADHPKLSVFVVHIPRGERYP